MERLLNQMRFGEGFWHNRFVVGKAVAASAVSSSFNLQFEDFSSLLYFTLLFFSMSKVMLIFSRLGRIFEVRFGGDSAVSAACRHKLFVTNRMK